jgi:putative hemolysin
VAKGFRLELMARLQVDFRTLVLAQVLLFLPQAGHSLENPAWRACAEAGGRSAVFYKAGEGASQWRVCSFNDNSWCLAWDLHEGSCSKGQQKCRLDKELNFCLPPGDRFCHWQHYRAEACAPKFYQADKADQELLPPDESVSFNFERLELGLLVEIINDDFSGVELVLEQESLAKMELLEFHHEQVTIQDLIKQVAQEYQLSVKIEGAIIRLSEQ